MRWSPVACLNLRLASATASRCSETSKKSLDEAERTDTMSSTSAVHPYSLDAMTAQACCGSRGNAAICRPGSVNFWSLSIAPKSHNVFNADPTIKMSGEFLI